MTPAMAPAVVTGAAGGVGSVAIALLKAAGGGSSPRPAASPRRVTPGAGASEVIHGDAVRAGQAAGEGALGGGRRQRRLAHARQPACADPIRAAWGGLRARGRHGFAGVGLAFVLRGVRLLGVDSVQCPMPARLAAWSRLARDLDRAMLAWITETIPFNRVFEAGERILQESAQRIAVEIG